MLVSIVVITYNSGAFILETLESIKLQKYKNIELIVSDDGSTDETVKIVEKWLLKNKNRFRRSILLRNIDNKGVVNNVNKGCKEAKGKWIKIIAGDDLLLSTCISDNIHYVERNPKVNFLFSKLLTFGKYEIILPKKEKELYYTMDYKDQHKYLIRGNFILAPTSFIKKRKLQKLGYFDTNFWLIEDWSMWLKATMNKEKLYYMDKVTVKYRVHHKSISENINEVFLKDIEKIREIYAKSLLEKYHLFLLKIVSLQKIKKIKILLKLLSPLYWTVKILEYRKRSK